MNATPLYFVWNYNDADRAFWAEHLEGWLPARIIDAHMHVMDPALRREPMTEAMRRQYWVNEVFECLDGPAAEHCYRTVFPGREVKCLAFGFPDLAFDLERGNDYVRRECERLGWLNLAVIRPQWSPEKVSAALAGPGVIGVKPYYSLIGADPDSRDAYLEASIFDFLPHATLEVVNERKGWVTLHVPKAARLGHPDNLREVREIRRRYPDIVLVIAHLGRCYTEEHAREALVPLSDDPGIYFDTSAVITWGRRGCSTDRTIPSCSCAVGGSIMDAPISTGRVIRFTSIRNGRRQRSRRGTRCLCMRICGRSSRRVRIWGFGIRARSRRSFMGTRAG
jgi:hypothetical protein